MSGAYAPVTSAFPQRGSGALCKGQTTAALIESDTQAEGARASNVERKRKKKETLNLRVRLDNLCVVSRMTGSTGKHNALITF